MKIAFNKATDIIQVIAPASRPNSEDHDKLLNRAIDLLGSKGFKAIATDKILSKSPTMFYANTLKERTADFLDAMQDERVKIIWCLRGGYGSAEVANEVLDLKLQQPKILIGFSDITSLHALFNQIYGLPSIHGNNICSVLKHPESLEDIINLLSGKPSVFKLSPLNEAARSEGLKIEGKIAGGNLKILTTLIGTKLAPNFENQILMIEDINEAGYAIMRDLMHLEYSGLLKKIKAIVFGDFIKGDRHVNEVISFFSNDAKIPAFKTENFGHDDINIPITLDGDGIIENQILTSLSHFVLLP
jgi:muramoyltetrapeptide carboxypeptidase